MADTMPQNHSPSQNFSSSMRRRRATHSDGEERLNHHTDCIVVGSGIAGLRAAIDLAHAEGVTV
jgi:heterodisulfide reductase subunit A-like polyferredoxin